MFMCTSMKCNTCFSLIFFQVCGFLFPFNVAGGKSAGTDSYESRIVGHIIKIPRNSLRQPSSYLSLYGGPCQTLLGFLGVKNGLGHSSHPGTLDLSSQASTAWWCWPAFPALCPSGYCKWTCGPATGRCHFQISEKIEQGTQPGGIRDHPPNLWSCVMAGLAKDYTLYQDTGAYSKMQC